MYKVLSIVALLAVAAMAQGCKKSQADQGTFARIQEQKAQEENQPGVACGDVYPGMTYEQLIEKKGKHFKKFYCKGGLLAYRYDDVTVVLATLKVQKAWPTVAKDSQLTELTNTDPGRLRYEDQQ